ncbi:MAG: carboxypeptidase-like regulatory domain-containing protein [Polyangiales bacterium]
MKAIVFYSVRSGTFTRVVLAISLFSILFSGSIAAAQHMEELNRVFGGVEPPVSSERDESVPAGEIQIRVIDEKDAPVKGASVRVGEMQKEGDRGEQFCTTDESGACKVEALPTGNQHIASLI